MEQVRSRESCGAFDSGVAGDRRLRNWWSFILCIRNRNNTQEPYSETREIEEQETESDKQKRQINKTRVTKAVQ